MKKLLVFALIAAAGWFYFHESPANWRGMPAAKDPDQTVAVLPPSFDHGDYRITPLACYHVTAVVLSRERYRNDQDAQLAPVDLSLGWGPMSIAGVINDLNISQSGRWYEYLYHGEPPLEPGLMATHSANTHCLPATPEVRSRLLSVKRHDLVSMDGYLVEVAGPNNEHWRSSLTRDDTGGGACEVMWITALQILPAPR